MIRFVHPLGLALLLVAGLVLVLGRGRLKAHLLPVLACCLVALAVASPQLRLTRNWETVTFLVDRSPSVATTVRAQEAQEEVESIMAANPDRQFGAEIAFATTAVVAGRSGEEPALSGSVDLGDRTDLSAAVELGLVTLPPEGAGQLVLLSDGRITQGIDKAVAAALQAGVPISTLAIGRGAAGDAALVRFDVPGEVEVNRPFQTSASVTSQDAAAGTLILYRDGELLWTKSVSLSPGITTFTATETLPSPGAHTYRILVKRPGDPLPQNDGLSAFVTTADRPELLAVSSSGAAAIAPLLRAVGRPFVETSALPSLQELSAYREVLVSEKRLGELTQQETADLRAFVGELGGGLVIAQGEGDLRGLAPRRIEDLLPVSYAIPQQGREASLCVVYLLDHSGSMAGSVRAASKLDVLKEATAASVALLSPQTLVGMIAFNRNSEQLQPLQPLGEGRMVYQSLESLDANGGTDIYYPIVDALDMLEKVDAREKHVILFSDGKTADEYRDYPALLERLQAGDVTLTSIAIGPNPNLALLETLAQAGHGSVYAALDFNALPRVSIEATQRLTRSRFSHDATPVSGPLATADLAGLPALQGHVVTYPKPTAEVLLSAGDDPVVARWRIGLGQVTVVNSDLAGAWSADWLSWTRAPLLIDALLATAEPTHSLSAGLSPSVEVTDDALWVRVDARDPAGGFANFLDLSGSILPSGETQPLRQVAPGYYEASLPSPGEGGYALRVSDRTRDMSVVVPFSVPYLAEYRSTGADEETLRRIAAATGGRYITDEILPGPSLTRPTARYVDIHTHLLLAALGVFVLDLVVRKVPRRLSKRPPTAA